MEGHEGKVFIQVRDDYVHGLDSATRCRGHILGSPMSIMSQFPRKAVHVFPDGGDDMGSGYEFRRCQRSAGWRLVRVIHQLEV